MSEEITKELKSLRRGEGLTASKLLSAESTMLNLPVVGALVTGQDNGSNRALAVCAVIHDFLHRHHVDSRDIRALAWALNLNVNEPWSGELVGLSSRQLMARRDLLAEYEMISPTGGGKPMSDWEATAIATLSRELVAYVDPPVGLNGGSFHSLEPSQDGQAPSVHVVPAPDTGREPQSSHAEPPRSPSQPNHPSGAGSTRRVVLAVGVAALVAAAFFLGGRLTETGSGADGVSIVGDEPTSTPTAVPPATEAPAPSSTAPPLSTSTAEQAEPLLIQVTTTPIPAPEPTIEPTQTPVPTAVPQPTPRPTPRRLDEDSFRDDDGDHPRSDTYFQTLNIAGQQFEDSVLIEVWTISPPDAFVSEFSTGADSLSRFQATVGMSDGSDSQAVVRLVITDERLAPPLYSRNFRLGEHEVLDLPIDGVVRLRFEVTVLSGRTGEYNGIGIGDPRLS